VKIPSKKSPTNLNLAVDVKQAARQLADENGEDLSEMVERLLIAEIVNPTPVQSKLEAAMEAARIAANRERGAAVLGATVDAHKKRVVPASADAPPPRTLARAKAS